MHHDRALATWSIMAVVSAAAMAGCGYGTTETELAPTADGLMAAAPMDAWFDCPERRPGDWEDTPDPLGDYADVVRVEGRVYERWPHNDGRLNEAALGTSIGVTCFRMADATFAAQDDGYDGDATYLPVGTELRAIVGGDPGVRVAALTPDGVAVYEVVDTADATIGSDVLDVGVGATEIGINNPEDGLTRLATIDDPDVVERIAASVADTELDRTFEPDRSGPRVFVEFVWADGTSSTRSFLLDEGVLHPAMTVDDDVSEAIEAALDDAGVEPVGDGGY